MLKQQIDTVLERIDQRNGALYGCSVLLEELLDDASANEHQNITAYHRGALTQAMIALARDNTTELERLKNGLS